MESEAKVTGAPDVPGIRGPSLDDIADVLARTNRGLLEVQRLVHELTALFLTFALTWFLIVLVRGR